MADVKKVTKKEMFGEVIALAQEVGRDDIVAFAEREIELLNKRNSADSKAKAKKAAENAELANKMVEAIAEMGKAVSPLEVATAVGVSTQKASPILNGLAEAGRLVKTTEKRKNFYSVAE